MNPLRSSLLSLGLVLSASFASAQTYQTQRVKFSNLGTFTQQQLEDVAAIHTGTSVTAATLGAAAQRLVNTGYFDDVGATITGTLSAATVKIELKPTPLDHMLHVGFTNLVWLTPEEIHAAILARVPLFNDFLIDNSPHLDDLKLALTAALTAKSITTQIHCADYEPTLQHPRREIACGAVRPQLRIVNVKLAGVTPALVPLVQKSVNATARTAYNMGPATVTTADRILAPLLDAGYAAATLSDVTPTLSPLDNGTIPVVFSARLQAGEIYKVSAITFVGTDLLTPQSFVSTAKLRAGDIASRAALLETLRPLDAAYRNKGYMDVVINSNPTPDDASHQIAYNVTVTPGEIYRVHDITANNLDPAARADFDRGFRLKPGDAYNADYVSGFLQNNSALRALENYSAAFKSYADPNTHTVDVVITFIRAAK